MPIIETEKLQQPFPERITDAPAYVERAKEHEAAQILDNIPAASGLKAERQKLSEQEAKLAEREAELQKEYGALESLLTRHANLTKELATGAYIAAQAQENHDGAIHTLKVWSFADQHPNKAYQGIGGAIEVAKLALAAKLVADLHPAWAEEKRQSQITLESQLHDQAKKLRLEHKLPEHLRKQCK